MIVISLLSFHHLFVRESLNYTLYGKMPNGGATILLYHRLGTEVAYKTNILPNIRDTLKTSALSRVER